MKNIFLSILSLFALLSAAVACPDHDQKPTPPAESTQDQDLTESD
ncbi:hypothetical protein [Candidatus Odyssella acanthamoebae]|nr:hypothetical protein [Candidatus Paracaedibacter acanthamoebae]